MSTVNSEYSGRCGAQTYGNITFGEFIPLLLLPLTIGFKVILAILLYPFRKRKISILWEVYYTFTREICKRCTVRQLQFIIPNDRQTYGRFIRASAGTLQSIREDDIGEGASIYWIGDKTSKPVMLYVHGGGYALPAADAHYRLVDYWRKRIEKDHNIHLNIAMLDYSLANFAPWPQQLRQVAAALTHLLNMGLTPPDIILGGDSAGGKTVLSLLSHILHPHPLVSSIPTLSEPLAGAVVISPWVTYSQSTSSWKQFAEQDWMHPLTLRSWADLCIKSRVDVPAMDDTYWFEPGMAPSEWWSGLGNVVSQLLATAGSAECMRDDIIEFIQKIRESMGKKMFITFVLEDGASHCGPVQDFALCEAPGAVSRRAAGWIADVSLTK